MTINAQVKSIMEHPYYPVAIKDKEAMSKLLFEIIFHTYSVCSNNASKVYRQWKGLNTPECAAFIRDMPPPVNLDVRMPIPPLVEECPVIPLTVVRETKIVYIEPKKIRVRCLPDPFQYVLDFPQCVAQRATLGLMEG